MTKVWTQKDFDNAVTQYQNEMKHFNFTRKECEKRIMLDMNRNGVVLTKENFWKKIEKKLKNIF